MRRQVLRITPFLKIHGQAIPETREELRKASHTFSSQEREEQKQIEKLGTRMSAKSEYAGDLTWKLPERKVLRKLISTGIWFHAYSSSLYLFSDP